MNTNIYGDFQICIRAPLRKRNESGNNKNWGIIFEETVTFPVWLDLMRSDVFRIVGR